LYKKAADDLSAINRGIELEEIQKSKENYQSFSTKHSTQPQFNPFSRNKAIEQSKSSAIVESKKCIQVPHKVQVSKKAPKVIKVGRNDLLKVKIGPGTNKTVIPKEPKELKRTITPIKKFK